MSKATKKGNSEVFSIAEAESEDRIRQKRFHHIEL